MIELPKVMLEWLKEVHKPTHNGFVNAYRHTFVLAKFMGSSACHVRLDDAS